MKRKIKIIVIAGARPNFVKIAPLFEEFKKHKGIKPVLVHTGQHYDFNMSKVFFKNLNIPKPDYNLNIGSGLHGEQTANAITGIEKICLKEKPDLMVVLGDVNSTLAGALAAVKLHIPLCHIEAGLRSYDKKMPEEINRILTDHVSALLFCPTKTAVDNLRKEGITKGVYNTEDIMYDVFLKNIKIARKEPKILKNLNLKPKNYMLLTIHRASNTGDFKKLKKIIEAAAKSGKNIVFPCHPGTRNKIKKAKLPEFSNLKIINPVGYIDMIALEDNSEKIITDSGGVQKEAYWLKVPCITLRDNTEWVETAKTKWNILTGSDYSKIIKAIKYFNPPSKRHNYFGSGRAAQKMIKIIMENTNERL